MEAGEEATLNALRAHREVVDGLIAAHRGRVFNSAGDSVVAEFPSAVEAINCAVEIQQEIARRSEPVARDKRLEFRIGLNIGDVMAEGGNLFGEGVNVAARVQDLAKPGGICASRNVYNQVKNKVGFGFEALGEHRVKNITEPVTIYRVLADATAARPPLLQWLSAARRHRRWLPALMVLVLLGVGASTWYVLQQGAPGAGKPAIAVLPLQNMGGDEATERLADGLTGDIITDLARFRDLDVIAHNSTAVYKGKAIDMREVGRDLKVGYVLEGSIQRHADQIRITAQLIDAATGTHLWSERWDRPVEDTFAIQTEVAERVAGTLGSINGLESITAAELQKVKAKPPANLTAYDYYLLAVEAKGTFTKEAIFAGIDAATKAIAFDPTFARAYAVRARLRYNTITYGADYDTLMREMEADARRAVELDPNEPEARAALAWYLLNLGRLAESEIEIRAALEANPANVNVLIFAAATLAWNGRPEEGAELADKVLRIDPRASSGSLNTIKDAYFFARRFDDVIAVISRIPENARSRGSRLFLVFSYALLGRHDEAARARDELLAKYPSMSAEFLLNTGWVFGRPQEENLFFDGFRAAGVSLCASDADLAKVAKPRRLPECLKPKTTN
jgi:TolB-like protein